MKKELIIEMEEECVGCPKLSLETSTWYYGGNNAVMVHKCEHLEFCKPVRRHWEDVMNERGNNDKAEV